MNLLEEPEPDNNKINRHHTGQSDLFFPKHYLLLEVERLEVSIRHFFEAGTICKDDFEYMCITLKMIKKFLHIRLQSPKEKQLETPYKTHNNQKRQTKRYKVFHKHKHSHIIQPSLFNNHKPLPIAGEIVVSGLTESLKELKTKSPEFSGPKFPYKIPAGTHWNNVIIKFLDDERVEIWVKRLYHVTDYKEMGMVGRGKTPEPGEQWIFLKVLAQCRGELTIRDTDARDTYKKQKQALTETLQQYFSIDYDPFYPYKTSPEKRGNSYKIKIILLPPPETGKDILHKEEINHDPLGISEFLSEEAPQVADF